MNRKLTAGIYELPPTCKAFVRDGKIIVSLKRNTAPDCNRCRDCAHFAYGCATYGGFQHSPVCHLRPKTYRYDPYQKNGSIFYGTQPSKPACDKFQPIPPKK